VSVTAISPTNLSRGDFRHCQLRHEQLISPVPVSAVMQSASDAITEIELACFNAWTKDERSEFDPLISADYVTAGAFGEHDTSWDRQRMLRSGELNCRIVEATDVEIKFHGEIAVLTARVKLTGQRKGRDISGEYQHTRIYSLRSGSWRAVAGQLHPL
jgi:hypothetical protein